MNLTISPIKLNNMQNKDVLKFQSQPQINKYSLKKNNNYYTNFKGNLCGDNHVLVSNLEKQLSKRDYEPVKQLYRCGIDYINNKINKSEFAEQNNKILYSLFDNSLGEMSLRYSKLTRNEQFYTSNMLLSLDFDSNAINKMSPQYILEQLDLLSKDIL